MPEPTDTDPLIDEAPDDAEADAPAIGDDELRERTSTILDLLQNGEVNDALEATRALAREQPLMPEPYFLFGLVAARLGDLGRATSLIRHAHEIDPDCRDYAEVLGVMLTKSGALADGLYFAKLATTLDAPSTIGDLVMVGLENYFEALQNVKPSHHVVDAMVAYNAREFVRASEYAGMALRVDRANVQALTVLGQSLTEIGSYDRAMAAFHTILQLHPDATDAAVGLAECLDALQRPSEADAVRASALQADPNSPVPAAAQVRALARRAPFDAEALRAAEAETQRRLANDPFVLDPGIERNEEPFENKPLRVGFLTDTMFESSDARFFADIIIANEVSRLETYVYQGSVTQNELIMKLQGVCEGWREVYDLDPDVVAAIIASDEIDALIDVRSYHSNKFLVPLAIKPSPVQIGWFNHVDGSGSGVINAVFCDPMTQDADDANRAEDQFLAVLECGLLAMAAPHEFGPVQDSPAKSSGVVTFGASADVATITPETARLWSDVLRAAPNSRLVLRCRATTPEESTARITDMFAHFGMVGRVKFYQSEADVRIDPAFFDGIDIQLDSYPVSRPEDLALGLWAGVPAVTLKGPTRAGRLGASALFGADRTNWVADTREAFVETAADLAADIDALADLRAGLRDSVQTSNLLNPRRLAGTIEAAVRHILDVRESQGG